MSRRTSMFAWLIFGTLVSAADWPQWRGPNRDGVSTEAGLLEQWPAGGPKLAWKIATLGEGYSGPAVVGDGLYILGTSEGKEVAFRLDAKSGAVVWKVPIGEIFDNKFGNGPRSTPTVVGDMVYVLGAQGRLMALNAADGKTKWSVDLRADLDAKLMRGNVVSIDWGFSESPLVDGDRLIVTPGGKKGTVAALDRATGKLAWRSSGLFDNGSYASLVRAEIGGVAQYVVLTGGIEKSIGLFLEAPPKLAGIGAADGKLLWSYAPNYGGAALAVTPVAAADGAYCSLPYGAGCARVRVERTGDLWRVKKVFANKVMKNYHGGVIRLGGHLFGYSEAAGWVCQDFETGEEIWSWKGNPGKGSLVVVGKNLYIVTEDGEVILAEASTKSWNEISRFKLPAVSPIRAGNGQIGLHTPPVIANGRLYLRDQELLYCYEVAGKK